MEGKKFDNEKPDMSLLPALAMQEVAKVMTHGKFKYDAHNWLKGMNWSRVISALERHLNWFKVGIDIDQDSGLLHISQVACNALFLTAYQIMNIGKDDRWKIPDEHLGFYMELQKWLESMMEQAKQSIPLETRVNPDDKVISLELDTATKQQLYNLAKKENKTIREIVREAVEISTKERKKEE
jgi:hypothetical protein